mgnify:CR=1 FL=1
MLRYLSLLTALLACWVFAAPSTARSEPPAAVEAEAPATDVPTADASPPDAPAPAAAPEAEAVAEAAATKPTVDEDAMLRERARRVRALIEGTLSPAVDAAALLQIDLADEALVGLEGAQLRALLEALDAEDPVPDETDTGNAGDTGDTGDTSATDDAESTGTPEPAPPPAQPSTGIDALAAAYRAWGRLDADTRQQKLDAHAQAHAAYVKVHPPGPDGDELVAKLASTADRLQSLLDGTLDIDVDPRELLKVPLDPPWGLLHDDARRRRALAGEATEPKTPLEKVQAKVDALRWQFLALEPEARRKLLADHAARVAAKADAPREDPTETEEVDLAATAAEQVDAAEREATEARVEREKALREAERASTQLKRDLAAERARLLGIKEAQANYEAELGRVRQARGESHTFVKGWSTRVEELVSGTLFDDEKAAEADPMYVEIREDLGTYRAQLHDALRALRAAGEDAPTPGEGLKLSGIPPEEVGDLPKLRAELKEANARLVTLAEKVGWEQVIGLRDDVVSLNESRLRLLAIGSDSLRSRMTGFGKDGVDQVERELDQISLVTQVLLARVPRLPRLLYNEVLSSPIPMLMSLAELGLLLLVFWWWRRRGTKILAALEHAYQQQRPATRTSIAGATAVWYLRRIRRPLETLVFIAVLLHALQRFGSLPSTELVWVTALWFLGGLAAILLVDAIAARDTLFSTDTGDTSALRIHSLRVVGLNVILVGWILAMTSATVGKGAIYSWVLSTCWLLSFPVVIYLVRRWRSKIFEMYLQGHEDGRMRRFIADNRTGAGSYLAATAGGALLLAGGISRWTMRQLSGFEATRRLLAYLFRREVAKQAASARETSLVPLERKKYDRFDPEALGDDMVGEVAGELVQQVVAVTTDHGASLSAVVGERGAGKSSFLRRVQREIGEDDMRIVSCPRGGMVGLRRELARTFEAKDAKTDTLREHLRAQGNMVIAIDDAQRLVRPAIRGLSELDKFTEFARSVGGNVSWVVAMGTAGWNFMRRARGDRVFFEQVIELPHWSEEQLGSLIRARTKQAGLDPSFEGLAVPKQAQTPLPAGGNRTEHGYHRLLWDFSRGNPAVALQAWRESLFTHEGKLVVRLFKEPSPEEIERLPLPLLFVLRAAVQLELAPPGDIVAATQLPASDVADALRFCTSKGYLEDVDGHLRLTWTWYRTITTVLVRQHLLTL